MMMGYRATVGPPPLNIVITGNSTTSVADGNWPPTFAALRPRDNIHNSAISGGDTQDLIDGFASLFTAFKSATRPNHIIFFEGANLLDFNFNDGHGHSFGAGWTDGAQAYPKTAEFCALAHINGWKVYVMTLDHWNDNDYNLPAFHTAFDQYNAAVRSNPGDYDGLIEFVEQGVFDPDNDPNNYYSDGVHKTAAGDVKLGQLVAVLYANLVHG